MDNNPADSAILNASFPLSYRISRSLESRGGYPAVQSLATRLARSRDLYETEYVAYKERENDAIVVSLVAPRVLIRISVTLETSSSNRDVKIELLINNEWKSESAGISWQPADRKSTLQIKLRRLVVCGGIRIQLSAVNTADVDFKVTVLRHYYRDMQLLAEGVRASEQGDQGPATTLLRECEFIAPRHYLAQARLAMNALNQGRLEDARIWGARGSIHSQGKYGHDVLVEACRRAHEDLVELVRKLRDESRDWNVGGHFGAICLSKEEHLSFGIQWHHLVYCREIVEVRRQAAARILKRLYFECDIEKERPVFARLRILRGDGRIVEVPDEHLVFRDHAEQDPSIRTQNRKLASIYLPEIERGDVLELVYSKLCGHPKRPDGIPECFVTTDLNASFPTWHSRITIDVPKSWPWKCLGINGAPQPDSSDLDNGYVRYHAEMRGLNYDGWGTYAIERQYRSPRVCCATSDRTWKDIAEVGREKFCHVLRGESLPSLLVDAISSGQSAEDKLRLGFEWIRDHLKYMSLRSAKIRTDDPDVGNKIVQSGVGDCMDRAYLVLLLARELGFEAQYAVTSAELGHCVRELPGPQFDHIFVRVRSDYRWLYLDATSSETPFGWIPTELQGMDALTLGPNPELITVPEEPPEANQLCISEKLVCGEDGRLSGKFEILAIGIPAFWWERYWKGSTMGVADPARIAQQILKQHIPAAEVTEWETDLKALGRERFSLSGRHIRRRTLTVDSRLAGILDWKTDLFTENVSAQRDWNGISFLPLPIRYTISLEIQVPSSCTIEGHSTIVDFDSEAGMVATAIDQDDGSIRMTRFLTVKRRIVEAEGAKRMPELIAAWEEARRFAFLLRRK